MRIIDIEFIGLPYLEVIPSISIARGNLMISWLLWGIFIKWTDPVEMDGPAGV